MKTTKAAKKEEKSKWKRSKTVAPLSAYLNVSRWIAVIDCYSHFKCKHQWKRMIRRPGLFAIKWTEWMKKKQMRDREREKYVWQNGMNTKCKPITNGAVFLSISGTNPEQFDIIPNHFSSSQTLLSTNGSYILRIVCTRFSLHSFTHSLTSAIQSLARLHCIYLFRW